MVAARNRAVGHMRRAVAVEEHLLAAELHVCNDCYVGTSEHVRKQETECCYSLVDKVLSVTHMGARDGQAENSRMGSVHGE